MSPKVKKQISLLWMPLGLFTVLAVITFLLWQVITGAEKQRAGLETQVTAEQVKLRLEAWFDTRGAVITQFGEEWAQDGAIDQNTFSVRAQRIIELFPGFQALNFVDPTWTIQTVVPLEGNQPALGKDLHDHPMAGVKVAMQQALDSNSISRTTLIQLLQGGPGFATYFPVQTDEGEFLGIINGVFGVDELVDSCLSESRLREHFNFRLRTPEQNLAYLHQEDGTEFARDMVVTLPVRIVTGDWLLEMTLSQKGLQEMQTPADELLAGIGLGVALLAAIFLYGYQVRQRELSLGKEQYRLLVENQMDFVFMVNTNRDVSYVSPSFARFMGRNEVDLANLRPFDLIHEDDRLLVRDKIRELTLPPHHVELEARLEAADLERWTHWRGSAFRRDDGQLDGFVWVGHDITQRRELEGQLRRSQRLQAVGQLAGGIAHDFNNILQAIQGYIEFVIEDLPEKSPLKTDLGQAQIAADRATVLIKQLLAFSRRQILKTINLDMKMVIEGLLPMLKRMVGPHIPIELQVQEGLHVIKADLGQMEQIIMNLAVNARDALGGNGQINIILANETVDESFCQLHPGATPGPHLRLDFVDNGSGMDQEVLDNLFEPFFSTKEHGSGTGLGLATVYGIIKQHGGAILVDSTPGVGSCFTLYLPAADGVVQEEEPTQEERDLSGKETILLAEDEPLLRNLAERILISRGYRVIAAEDGQQAWEIFQRENEKIDLGLFDIVMPRIDGRGLAELIRREKPDLPIIFVSGYDSGAAVGEPAPMKGTQLITKPYLHNLLLAAVRDALD